MSNILYNTQDVSRFDTVMASCVDCLIWRFQTASIYIYTHVNIHIYICMLPIIDLVGLQADIGSSARVLGGVGGQVRGAHGTSGNRFR